MKSRLNKSDCQTLTSTAYEKHRQISPIFFPSAFIQTESSSLYNEWGLALPRFTGCNSCLSGNVVSTHSCLHLNHRAATVLLQRWSLWFPWQLGTLSVIHKYGLYLRGRRPLDCDQNWSLPVHSLLTTIFRWKNLLKRVEAVNAKSREEEEKKNTPWKSNDWWEDCLARRNQCSHHLDANQSQYFHLKGAILLQRIMIVRSDYLHHHGLFLEDEGWSEMCSNHLAIVGKWTYNSWILFYKVLLLISMYISDRRASQTCFIVLQSSLNMC